MKKFNIILFLSAFIFQIAAQDVHEDAITAASYAYSHSKKAHGANNIFHTQEYADKAAEAFEKVEMLSNSCGCTVASEIAYEAKTNMNSSLDQDTYERSRYYAKQAKELAPKILKELTNCRVAITSDVYDIASTEDTNIADVTAKVKRKETALEDKKSQLKIEQAKLEQQIAKQQKIQERLEALRETELKQQNIIKTKAEKALANLENALQQLTGVFHDGSEFTSKEEYIRSENALQNETLDDTKSFYVNRAKELAKSAIQQFASFEEED